MNNNRNAQSLLSLVSKVSTMAAVLLLGVMATAKPRYEITVVSEAWVSNKASEGQAPTMNCKSQQSVAKGAARMTWQGSPDRKPEPILKISNSEAVIATRNTEDGFLNSVTLWLAVKSGAKTQYYPMTEIDMERYELPKVKLSGRTLTVEADTLTVDPKEDNEMFQIPTLPGQIYQMIRVGSAHDAGLGLSTLNCTR